MCSAVTELIFEFRGGFHHLYIFKNLFVSPINFVNCCLHCLGDPTLLYIHHQSMNYIGFSGLKCDLTINLTQGNDEKPLILLILLLILKYIQFHLTKSFLGLKVIPPSDLRIRDVRSHVLLMLLFI